MNTAKKGRAPRSRSGAGTGTTSLLMIFTVLCFATLAMLSLSTAATYGRMQRRGAQNSQNLAAAKGEAAGRIAALDAALAELWAENTWESADYIGRVREVAGPLGWEARGDGGGIFAEIVTPIDDMNELVTELELFVPSPTATARFRTAGQYSRLAVRWEPEQGGEVWAGA